MRPAGVVIDPPGLDDLAGIVEIEEPVLVEAFIPEPPVEAFDEGVLCWLARLDEVEPNYGKEIRRVMAALKDGEQKKLIAMLERVRANLD